MKRWILPLLLLGSLNGNAQAPATDWGDLKLDLAPLGKWGVKNYVYFAREPGEKEGALLGRITLTTQLKDGGVFLRDRWELKFRGQALTLDIAHQCRMDNFLSPTRIKSKGEGDDELGTFVATVADGKATVSSPGQEDRVIDLPEGTITMAAMMRLVTLVPQVPGKVYTFDHSLESEELNLKKDYRLTVLPPEEITVGGRKLACAKFELSGKGISPVQYWVTKGGELQRVMMDERKVIELDNVL